MCIGLRLFAGVVIGDCSGGCAFMIPLFGSLQMLAVELMFFQAESEEKSERFYQTK